MEIVKHKEKFIQWMKVKNMADSTIENYTSQLVSFLFYFKDIPRPIEVSGEQIMSYLLTKIKPNSQRHAHSAIKLFYTNVIGQPLKFKHIPYAKKEKKLPQALEENEIEAILSVCENIKHKAILYLAYACGLRVSEIIDLKIADIDSDSMTININLAKGKKDRIVPMPQELLDILRDYFKIYRPKIYLFNGQYSTNEIPTQYTDRSINQFFKDLALKAGIKKNVHIHLLRHSYASHSLEQGTDIRYIQEILGHSSPLTTQIYTHISKKAISRISSPLSRLKLK